MQLRQDWECSFACNADLSMLSQGVKPVAAIAVSFKLDNACMFRLQGKVAVISSTMKLCWNVAILFTNSAVDIGLAPCSMHVATKFSSIALLPWLDRSFGAQGAGCEGLHDH